MRACTLGIPVAANYACIWYDPCLILVYRAHAQGILYTYEYERARWNAVLRT